MLFCVSFTFQKSQEVVTKNIPVTKLKFEEADLFMFCNVVETDFYFPDLHNKFHNTISKVHA